MRYTVNVGNIGQVTDTNDEAEARHDFAVYVNQSKENYGRAAGEPVCLFDNGEPIEDYSPPCPAFSEQLPPPDPSWQEVLKETDWKMLREQKEVLIATINSISFSPNPLDGILHFLDSVQDAAAEEIGEDKVFDHFSTEDQETDRLAGNDEPEKPIFAVTVNNMETVVFHVPARDEDHAREIVEGTPHDELIHDPTLNHEVVNADYGIEDISPDKGDEG